MIFYFPVKGDPFHAIRPDPDAICPNEKIKSACYIKNVITRPNIIVGDYTYLQRPGRSGKNSRRM